MIENGSRFRLFLIGAFLLVNSAAGQSAEVERVMSSRYLDKDFKLSADTTSAQWIDAPLVIAGNNPFGVTVPGAETKIKSRWTPRNLYFLFVSPYQSLHRRPQPTPEKEAWGLWEYDVAEVFIGYDLHNINVYKEFEVSPDGEFIDLDVDRSRKGKEVDWLWNSGFQYKTRIDSAQKVWICEMQIPWSAIDSRVPKAGNELRLNLYRIEGGPKNRKYIVWQTIGNPSFHTPDKFGRLRLAK
jgi:hypothetical protein